MEKRFVYADNAATTRVSEAAFGAMLPWLTEKWGNPSSAHSAGMEAAKAVLQARSEVAGAIGADRPGEIFFTSGGTESDNWAIVGAARLGADRGRRHIVTTSIEHPAVLNTARELERMGFEVTYLPCDSEGYVSVDEAARAIRGDTCLVSVMAANNEVGTLQPIREIAEVSHERGALFHTDAVQAVGQTEVDVRKIGGDMLSLSGHKLRGPKGVGVLYCREGLKLPPLILGGGQEQGRRSGTENVPAIAGLGAAIREAVSDIGAKAARLRTLRDSLAEMLSAIPDSRINGGMDRRLPGNLNMSFGGIEGEALLMMLSMRGICVSSGSACSAGSLKPSHVLSAMGVEERYLKGSVRITLSEDNSEDDIRYIAEQMSRTVRELREIG